MDLVNKINSAQRREVIDEDKRIHKRALDSEFAFLKRIGEDSLPPTKLDKRTLFNIYKLIEEVGVQLDVALEQIYTQLQPYKNEETGDYNEPPEDFILNIDLGKTISKWNNLVYYLKSFSNTNTLSPAEYQDLWDKIDERLLSQANTINNFQTYYNSYLFDDIEFKDFLQYLYDRNLSPIIPHIVGAETAREIRGIQGESFETPQQQEENRIARERQRMATIGDELRTGLQRRGRIQEGMRQAEQQQGLPAGFLEPMGLGLGKPKKSKKKMDEDEMQINIEVSDKIKDGKHQKNMKKAFKNLALPFDDSMDSNYLK